MSIVHIRKPSPGIKILNKRFKKMINIKVVFHFIDGDKHESILSVKPDEKDTYTNQCEKMMTSISDQIGKYNVLAFLDKQFSSSQFLIIRENIKRVEFFPLD